MSPGVAMRERFLHAMQATETGALVRRRRHVWTVRYRRQFDCAVELQLQCGRRRLVVSVPVCITGPCWADVDLQPVRPPTQAWLPGMREAAR